MKVGLIGIGAMGRLVLQKLIESGHDVYAYDAFEPARTAAAAVGAHVVEGITAVAAEASIVLISLPGPVQIEQVVAGDGGLLSRLGAGSVVVDLSTSDPGTTRRMSEQADGKQVGYVDAPILGRPASLGRWVLPLGGSLEWVDKCKPVLECFTARVVHVGPSGSGHALKLLNQLMFATINTITAEVMAICAKTGLSQEVFFDTISSSGAATVSNLFVELARKIVADEYDPVFSVDLLYKDNRLGVEMAREAGAPPVISNLALTMIELARTKGLGKLDSAAVVKVYEDLYGC